MSIISIIKWCHLKQVHTQLFIVALNIHNLLYCLFLFLPFWKLCKAGKKNVRRHHMDNSNLYWRSNYECVLFFNNSVYLNFFRLLMFIKQMNKIVLISCKWFCEKWITYFIFLILFKKCKIKFSFPFLLFSNNSMFWVGDG